MSRQLKQVAQWHDVTPEVFQNEIVPLYEPAILKNHVAHWPAVAAAKESNQSLLDYLNKCYAGGKVRFARLSHKYKGLLAYKEDYSDLNFIREIDDFPNFISEMLAAIEDELADTVAIQSAPVADYFPQFLADNQLSLFPNTVLPRVWLGNDAVVSAHYDDSENIACLVSGKRRFTLFPPEQVENLYVGPIDFTPAGAPVSLVDFSNPDFDKFPKFRQALNHALVAELEPGDAIYIPTLWWHHVVAYGGLNTLINYWMGGSIAGNARPVPADNLLMGLLSIRELPQRQKDAWRAILDYFVFSEQADKHQHIPQHIRGMLARLSHKQASDIRKWLSKQLK